VTRLRHHTEPDTLVLTPDGTIHAGEVPALLTAADALLDEGSRTTVVLDLSLVRTPGLAAIDALMRLHLLARRRGRSLKIRHITPRLEQALQQTGLSVSLPLRETCHCRVCAER
jgi:anti-anti-sigma factor